jgi:PhnB protein
MHIPPGFTTVFPYIFAKNAEPYLDFLAEGLAGEIVDVDKSPEGAVRKAQVSFGDTTIMVSDAREWREPSRLTCYLYVEDADSAVERALAAGGKLVMPVADMPYGDRQGGVEDPRGNIWWISQRLRTGAY